MVDGNSGVDPFERIRDSVSALQKSLAMSLETPGMKAMLMQVEALREVQQSMVARLMDGPLGELQATVQATLRAMNEEAMKPLKCQIKALLESFKPSQFLKDLKIKFPVGSFSDPGLFKIPVMRRAAPIYLPPFDEEEEPPSPPVEGFGAWRKL